MKKLVSLLAVSVFAFGIHSALAAESINENFENGLKYGLEESFSIVNEGGNHSMMMDSATTENWISAGIADSKYKFSDFTFTCDIKLLAFPVNGAALNIFFRMAENSDASPTGYRFLLGYQDSSHAADTFNVQFERNMSGKREWPSPAVDIDEKVKLSTWSKLKIVAKGDKFDLYLGAKESSMEKVCSATDSSHKQGIFRFAVWGAKVQIDNLSIVSGADTNPPPPGPNKTTTAPNTPKNTTTAPNTPNKTTTVPNAPNKTTTAPGGGTDATGGTTGTGDDSSITTADTNSNGTSAGRKTDPSANQANGDDKPGGMSTGAIVAIIVVAVLAAGAAVTLVILKKKGILFKS